MHYGWTAPVVPILKGPDTPVNITEAHVAWLESCLMLGDLAGLPITIFFVDRIGRKYSIIFSAAIGIVCWLMIALTSRVEVLLTARFLAGIIADVAFVASPMYIAEVADQKLRGFLAGMTYLMMLVGLALVYIVAPFVTVFTSSMVGIGILVVHIATFIFMPQSPYFLLMKNKKEKAFKNLQWFRNNKHVEKEMEEIAAAVERQQSERGRPQDLLLVKSNRKAMIIMSVLNGAQHFTGISVILMNVHSILLEAGSTYIDSDWAGIIFGLLMIVAATTALSFVDRSGRKILLTASSFLTGISLAVIAVYFVLKNSGYDTSSYSWVPVASIMAYAIVFKSGLGIVPSILASELYPTSVKAMGITIADSTYVIFSTASIYMYQGLVRSYGIHVPFFVFAVCTVLVAVFCHFYIPETKGKTLEEIQFILKGIDPTTMKSIKNGKPIELQELNKV